MKIRLRASTFLTYLGPLTLNGWNIPFVSHVKYLGVIFVKRIIWRLHIEMTEAKAFRTFITIYSLFKSERLNAHIELNLHKALIIRISNDLRLPRLGISGRHLPLKIAEHAKQGSAHHWKSPKVHTSTRFAHSFQPSVCIRLDNKIVQATS
jgi:hypothetical protein